jgi:hypothetical protein
VSDTKLAYSVVTFAEAAEISVSQAYKEIAEGRLIPSYRGRNARIPVEEAKRWINALPTEKPGA